MLQRENNFIDNQKEENNYLICKVCGNKMTELGCKLKCIDAVILEVVLICSNSRKTY